VLECPESQSASQHVVPEHRPQSVDQLVGTVGQDPGLSVDHRILVASDPGHHRRCPTGAGLGDGHAPALAQRRRRHHPRAAIQRQQGFVVDESGQFDP